LGPTLVGVLPARSLNSFTYGSEKQVITNHFNGGIETAAVPLAATALAGFLHKSDLGGQDAHAIIRRTVKTFLELIGMYTNDPPREWHPQLVQRTSASYLGVSEGIIQWTLYEQLKKGAKKAEGSPLE